MIRKPASQDRRGVILLVVLAMLTIFALVGLSFVLYADSAATRARIFREAGTLNRFGDVRETALLSATAAWEEFLGQVLYDVNDDQLGVASALRGHSLGRTLYGWNDAPGALNDRPYTGTGRLQEAIFGTDNRSLINYTYFANDGALRDPAHLGTRPNPAAGRGPLTGDLNVAYTYPDLNNVFLAMIDPQSGQVIMPSYRRPYNEQPGPAGKYTQLHYRPQEMSPAFPAPVGNGHVKNLDNLDGGNDSVWLDYGGEVHIAPDGRKYKCMVAPCMIDMDGRMNINAAGNILATGDASASNMGWGAWEMNPSKLSGPTPNPLTAEWRALTLGNGTISGRYGPAGLPVSTALLGGTLLRRYAPVDLNAIYDPTSPTPRVPTARFAFPGQGTHPNTVIFPNYDPNAYGNAVPVETTTTGTPAGQSNHPSAYNPIRRVDIDATTYNRIFTYNDLAGILRRYNVGGETVNSDVLTLMPGNLVGGGLADPAARFRRSLLTTHSFDLDRPGSIPAIWDPAAAPYALQATGVLNSPAPTFPPLANRGAPPPAGSEFDPATWRSTLPPLRLDLSRRLAPFPPVAANGRFDMTDANVVNAVTQALNDRQAFAAEIFERLRIVVGASPAPAPGSDEFRAVRMLAQMAANIVDFIDNDEYNTTFQWIPGEYVYGVELPRLVINEYYAQFDNHHPDLSMAMPELQQTEYRLNVWAELHNPMPPEPAPSAAPEAGVVRLHNGDWAHYRLRLCQKSNPNMRSPDNTRGAYDPMTMLSSVVVDNWGGPMGDDTTRTVAANYGAHAGTGNQGFYLVGPNPDYAAPLAMTNPGLAARRTWGEDNTLSLPIPIEGQDGATTPTTYDADNAPSLLLEKLAIPYLPAQENPAQPFYNPYITIDYVHKLRVNEGRVANSTADISMVLPAVATRPSYGKVHPYAAADTTDATQPVTPATGLWQPANPVTPAPGEVLHTFMRHNSREDAAPVDPTLAGQTLKVPFDVLYHPDRVLVSPAELLHVSWYKPHELTQQFMVGNFQQVLSDSPGHRFQHRAAWTNPTTRLMRFLDHVSCGTFGAGVAANGRLPGRVNLNTLWDANVFNALVDVAPANHFTQAEVDAIYANFLSRRTPGGVPRPGDRPLLGSGAVNFAADPGVFPIPRGVDSTIYKSATDDNNNDDLSLRVFEPPPTPPATAAMMVSQKQRLERFELLTKIANNVTTRSNVFALWATVGFFEVVDDTAQPMRLGGEISWPGVGIIRHRMFAILDRSSMQVWPTADPSTGQVLCRLGNNLTVPPEQQSQGALLAVTLLDRNGTPINAGNPLVNPNTGRPWIPQPGAIITIDPGSDNEETVLLGPGLQARFHRTHAAGAVVISRGNPGPWIRYDPAQDPAVVPYHVIIE